MPEDLPTPEQSIKELEKKEPKRIMEKVKEKKEG